MKSARVLLTGGAGFIGLGMVRRLLDSGASVTVVDDLSRGRLDDDAAAVFSRPGIDFVQADLADRSSLDGLGADFETIVHLAAVIGIQAASREPVRVLRTNALSAITITDFWRRCRARMVFASTSEVYGALPVSAGVPVPTPEGVPVGIADPGIPRYSYAASKIFGEALVMQSAASEGLRALVVRPHNVYGPRMGFDHVIPQMSIRALRRENPFRVFGPDETRAFCYVDDFCAAVSMLMESGAEGIFHVGNDRGTRIGDLAEMILSLSGHAAPIAGMPSQTGSPARRCPDISKLREATGFSPSIALEEGLARTFAWYDAFAACNPSILDMDATP